MKKIVGISASMRLLNSKDFFADYKYCAVADDYINAVSKSGATPFVLPLVKDEEQIENQILLIDALILSGGYDIDPYFYKEEPLEKLETLYPERDIYELKLIKFALKHKKPILGICRGFQLLNVAFGGTLYQDLSYRPNTFIKHNQSAKPSQATHSINIEENSFLFKVAQRKEERVNSFHHLALKDVGANLEIVAVAKDGVIEAIEYTKDENFILGVQFHPEMMFETNDFSKNIFKNFINLLP
ncbi:MAG: gamma-glutamyl-gamma-aminobutyrate hydrolase family protein [Fusobacterium sp.]|nr:gamma-glutamyl-gamma-aminobutyrate hydrolase family protein [Fusobacterium sp.]